MDILQYINKMNRLYGNDPTPVRFNTQKYLQGGRVGYKKGTSEKQLSFDFKEKKKPKTVAQATIDFIVEKGRQPKPSEVGQIKEKLKPTAMKELMSRKGAMVDPTLLAKAGYQELAKPAGKILKRIGTAALSPAGIAGITYGAGFDPKKATDRMSVAAEAALAPELVKATIGATKGMKSRAAQKVVQQLLNLGLPTQTALRVARIASPLGLLALGGEGLYKMYKEGYFEKKRMMPSLMDKKAYAEAQKEKFNVSKPMFKSGGRVEYDNYLPNITDDDK